jgi:hypothetical protein
MLNMGMMWWVFSMQRGPVRKMKDVVVERYRKCIKIVQGGKGNVKAFFAPPCQDAE